MYTSFGLLYVYTFFLKSTKIFLFRARLKCTSQGDGFKLKIGVIALIEVFSLSVRKTIRCKFSCSSLTFLKMVEMDLKLLLNAPPVPYA